MFSGSLQDFVFVLCFGVFFPLITLTLMAVRNRPINSAGPLTRYWDVLEEFFNVAHYIFWGGISCLVVGLWLLRNQPISGAHVVCAFFAASGIGCIVGETAYNNITKKMSVKDTSGAD
jgi:hypothetical protein